MAPTPLVTLIRRALAKRLRQSELLTRFVGGEKTDPADRFFLGGRIFLNRFEAWDERDLTTIGLYVVSEEPIDTDINPPPDERRLMVGLEIFSREDATVEERLDIIGREVEALYRLPPLGALIEDEGGPDTLLKIIWLGNDRGYIPEGERTIGASIMAFSLEYQLPWEDAELPPWEMAGATWKARAPEGEIEAKNIVHIKQK